MLEKFYKSFCGRSTMTRQLLILATLLVFATLFIACTKSEMRTGEQPLPEASTAQERAPEPVEAAMPEQIAPAVAQEQSESNSPGSYESYAPEKVAGSSGNVVLFFHASWCPSCRGLSRDIEDKLDAIPQDLTILKVDYDQETALKQKYGVTTQHTLVQVDGNGDLVRKWSGGSSLEKLVAQVQ
jgi:thioredoxin 1